MTDEPIIKLKPTSAMEVSFRPGNHLSGIWTFLSGLGAKHNIITRLSAFIIHREGPEIYNKLGVSTHISVVTMLQEAAVLR